jgi:putative FmdB family regulatory protein
MPLFDLQCERCSAEFEELVLGDRPPVCPECGSAQVRRLFSPISPPRRIGLSPAAKRESDSRRSEREAARKERRSARPKSKDG